MTERLVHTAADIEHMCAWFEHEYGLSSEAFYAAHLADDLPDVPRFHRHVWASFYRDRRRLGVRANGSFTSRAERTLALT
jgi:hypothetical protein